jgi:fructose-bisphosphate aldolase class I
MGNRLAKVGVENTKENRRFYRQILFTSPPEACKAISAVILFHDTLYEKDDQGKPFVDLLKERNIIPGLFCYHLKIITAANVGFLQTKII